MGDSRPLAVLVDVAKITRHMPDLQTFLDRLPEIVQHRLGYEDVALYLVDPETTGIWPPTPAATGIRGRATAPWR